MQSKEPMEREREIIQSVREVIQKHLPGRPLLLFGSRAKGHASPGADFDFAVDAPKPSIEIRNKISSAIEALAGLYRVDVIYLQSVEEKFKNLVLKTGKPVL